MPPLYQLIKGLFTRWTCEINPEDLRITPSFISQLIGKKQANDFPCRVCALTRCSVSLCHLEMKHQDHPQSDGRFLLLLLGWLLNDTPCLCSPYLYANLHRCWRRRWAGKLDMNMDKTAVAKKKNKENYIRSCDSCIGCPAVTRSHS